MHIFIKLKDQRGGGIICYTTEFSRKVLASLHALLYALLLYYALHISIKIYNKKMSEGGFYFGISVLGLVRIFQFNTEYSSVKSIKEIGILKAFTSNLY